VPKIGQAEDTRPYNIRCAKCKCVVEKVISRFGWGGKAAEHIYRCAHPYHNCGTVQRDGCEPVRKYGERPAHSTWDGGSGAVEHPGKVEDCPAPECCYRSHVSLDGEEKHPGRLQDCESARCEPPF
jgi:hypothetical protein